jgi:hypothetical protein
LLVGGGDLLGERQDTAGDGVQRGLGGLEQVIEPGEVGMNGTSSSQR